MTGARGELSGCGVANGGMKGLAFGVGFLERGILKASYSCTMYRSWLGWAVGGEYNHCRSQIGHEGRVEWVIIRTLSNCESIYPARIFYLLVKMTLGRMQKRDLVIAAPVAFLLISLQQE